MCGPPIFLVVFIVCLRQQGANASSDDNYDDDYRNFSLQECSLDQRECHAQTIGEVALGCRSSTTCPDGYRIVTSATACQRALSSLSLRFNYEQKFKEKLEPPGCFYCGEHCSMGPGAQFNKHPVGMARCGAQPVCVLAVPTPKPTPATPTPTGTTDWDDREDRVDWNQHVEGTMASIKSRRLKKGAEQNAAEAKTETMPGAEQNAAEAKTETMPGAEQNAAEAKTETMPGTPEGRPGPPGLYAACEDTMTQCWDWKRLCIDPSICMTGTQCYSRPPCRQCVETKAQFCPTAPTSTPTHWPTPPPTPMPTSKPTSLPTPAPTQVPTAKAVEVQTTITGVNYVALVSNITLLNSFKLSIKMVVVQEMNNRIRASDVQIELAPGSVVASITISGLIDPIAESTALQMKSSLHLAGNIATNISEIPGIAAVTDDTIGGDTEGVGLGNTMSQSKTESDIDDNMLLVVLSVTFGCLLCTICLLLAVCAFRRINVAKVSPNNVDPVTISVEPCMVPSISSRATFGVVPTISSSSISEKFNCSPPQGKKYHYFLSHKKIHSRLNKQPEALALSLHDSLSDRGYTGFFDVDNLKTISKEDLERSVKDSALVIVCLHDETFQSEWCRLEWQVAEEHGIPIICVVDTDNFLKSDVIAVCSTVGCLTLLKHQWIAYSAAHRKQTITELTMWLEKDDAEVGIQPAVVTAAHC